MKKLIFIIIYFCFVPISKSFGQDQVSQNFIVEVEHGSSSFQIELYQLDYRATVVDLREISSTTKYLIPESISIVPPRLDSYKNLKVIVSILGDPKEPSMLIWLARNPITNNFKKYSFYLDDNQDLDFSNDGKYQTIKKGGEPIEITRNSKNLALTMPFEVEGEGDSIQMVDEVQDVILQASFSGAGIPPNDYSILVDGYLNPVEIHELNFRTPVVDLRQIAELTDFIIPQSIKIIPPTLNSYENVRVIVGLAGQLDRPTILVWINRNLTSNNFERSNIYLDHNQDRDFTNDGKPLSTKRGKDPLTFEMQLGYEKRKVVLNVPIIDSEVVENRGTQISISSGIGFGKLNYQPSESSKYSANSFEKSVQLICSWNIDRFHIGITASIHKSSFNNSILSYTISARRLPIFLNGVIVSYPREAGSGEAPFEGEYPGRRTQLGIDFSYLLGNSSNFNVQPFVSFGNSGYGSTLYTRENSVTSTMASSFYIRYGFRGEIPLKNSNAVFLEFLRNTEKFKIKEDLIYSGYESAFKILRFNVGYRFSL